jgi:hypothetical protein
MPEANHRKPGFFAPDPLTSHGQGEAPPPGSEKSPFPLALLPNPQNGNRPGKLGGILSPQGYPESTFRTLMKILGKGEKDSARDGGRKLTGSDQDSFDDPARH